MPIYEYEHIDEGHPGCEPVVEVIQAMSEDALTDCPACGKPVKRVISRASFIMGLNMSPESTSKLGFTTYRKSGNGTYEKAGGEGPDTISAGDD